jgi:polyisoprenoid-binding protein YceI
MLSRIFAVAISLAAFPSFAQWTLDAEGSSLHFLSTKNAQITEVHSFETLSGSVSATGMLSVEVLLNSVNTAIPIRDTRMQEKLFETSMYPTATFTAQVPDALLNIDDGETAIGAVTGTMAIHGMQAPVTFNVQVSKLDDDKLTVATVAPTIIQAQDFGLKAGIEALQTIAGLNSITFSSPVTFSVTFSQ